MHLSQLLKVAESSSEVPVLPYRDERINSHRSAENQDSCAGARSGPPRPDTSLYVGSAAALHRICQPIFLSASCAAAAAARQQEPC